MSWLGIAIAAAVVAVVVLVVLAVVAVIAALAWYFRDEIGEIIGSPDERCDPGDGCGCDDPSQPCPEPEPERANLRVRVWLAADERTAGGHAAQAGVAVRAMGPCVYEQRTNADGWAAFCCIEPGAYSVELAEEDLRRLDTEDDDLFSAPQTILLVAGDNRETEFFIHPFYTLQFGDNDAERRWETVERPHPGELVYEVQRRLGWALGYWISHPDPDRDHGFSTDGIFGQKTQGAVYLFQLEQGLAPTEDVKGKVDRTCWNKLCELSDGLAAGGQRYRKVPAAIGTAFVQLAPSMNFWHRGTISDSYRTDVGVYLEQNWGKEELCNLIHNTGDYWASFGFDLFEVGDLSRYDGEHWADHDNHTTGEMADINHDSYCNMTSDTFDKEAAFELAAAFINKGANRILFNCAYVIDSLPQGKVHPCYPHHHHMHVTLADEVANPDNDDIKQICKRCTKLDAGCDYQHRRGNGERDGKEVLHVDLAAP